MSEPLVSVIVPTYNRAGIIGETIENIFQQTYPNIELIIVDDGSADSTQSVLASYGQRIKWTTQPNAGPSAARNRGIAMAEGEIIAFQDSDDLWHPTKIERQVSLLERAGGSVVCCLCNTNIYSVDGSVMTSFDNAPIDPPYDEGIWTNVAEVLTTRFILFNQAIAIRRTVLAKAGGFDENLKYLEDYQLGLRLALEGPWGFIRTPLVMQKQGTANSWSQGAFKEHTLIAEYNVSLRKDALRHLLSKGGDPALQALMEKYLKQAQRVLRDLQTSRSDSLSQRFMGILRLQVDRLRSAIGRRLPGYPTMKVEAIPAVPAGQTETPRDGGARNFCESALR